MGFLNNMGKLVNGTGLTGGKINFDKMLEGAAGLVVDGAKATAKGVKAGAEAAKERKARKEAAAQMEVDDTPDEPGAVVLYCTQCGKKITSSMKFCGSCGSAI